MILKVMDVLRFEGVSKVYRGEGGSTLDALKDVSVVVPDGRTVSITGRSGSGKSTFLHLAAGIDEPSRGEVHLLGRRLSELSDRERTLQRRDNVGLVFQFFHLLDSLSVVDNITLPGLIAGERPSAHRRRAGELLERVGLADRASETVHRLSGGEMQRVAICRALLRKPRLLLADEPTGNLDDLNGRNVMDLLLQLAREEGSTLIYVTHSVELASLADETWGIHSGILETP
jgi:ABC-type lipoprotein export system ATPase subunit